MRDTLFHVPKIANSFFHDHVPKIVDLRPASDSDTCWKFECSTFEKVLKTTVFGPPQCTSTDIVTKIPPITKIPPLLGHFEKQGGNFRLFRPEAEIFQDCDIENICVPFKIDRNERKIVFSKRKTSKFSRLRRGYTPSNPFFRACGAATTQAIIQNVSHIIQKVITQKILMTLKAII